MTSRAKSPCLAAWLLVLVGCPGDTAPAPSTVMQGELELELRDTVAVTLTPQPDGSLDVALSAENHLDEPLLYGIVPAGETLTGRGRVELFPEAGATLYTAKIDAAAQPSGPCGEAAMSLAMTLHRPPNNANVVGGISVYCGADTWYGNPVRVLRMSGSLPVPP